MDKEWNDNNLNTIINYCINIENNINIINKFNNNNLEQNIKIIFNQEEEQINQFFNTNKSFAEIIVEGANINKL